MISQNLRLILCLFIRPQINVYILQYLMGFETMGYGTHRIRPGLNS